LENAGNSQKFPVTGMSTSTVTFPVVSVMGFGVTVTVALLTEIAARI